MTAPMPPIAQDKLDALKDAEIIDWSPTGYEWLDKTRAEQLAPVIRANHGLKELCITTDMSDEALDVISDALRGHPSLESFRLKRQTLSADSLRNAADTCFSLPQLRNFQMKEVGLDGAGIRHVAGLAGKHPALNSLCLSKNPVDDISAHALGGMLEQNRHFRYIRLMDCELSDAAMIMLAERAAHQPEMVHFHLHYNPAQAPASQEVPRAMLAGGGLNLISCLPYSDASNRYCMENTHIAKNLVDTLATAETEGRGADVLTNAQAFARRPAMYQVNRANSSELLLAEQYMDSLPEVDSATPDLLAVNTKGQCPAENPRIWKDCESLFQQLEAAGTVITKDWLAQQTPRGESLLVCALTSAAHAAIPALNKRGIQIQTRDLLDSQKEPTLLLENLLKQNTCDALFTMGNWQGSPPEEVRGVMHALPEAARARIGNTYQLLARLGTEQSSHAQGR